MAPLTGIREGDLVEVDKKGRRFIAHVTATKLPAPVVAAGVKGTGITIRPVNRHETYHFAKANEVKTVWRKTRRNGDGS